MSSESIYKSSAGESAVMAMTEAMMARWPLPYKSLNVPTHHGNTIVIVCGKEAGPALLLLHGAGTNSVMWAGDVAEYGRQYHVYAVDLLGEPGKSAPNRPPWDGPAYAEWLEDVLDSLKIERATLIGLSQGGWTALKFAVYKPERVEKLVLLSPGGIVPDRLSFILRAVLLSLLGRWGIKRIHRMVLGGQTVSEEVEEAMTLIMTHFKPRLGVLPIFPDRELQRLTMPIMLLIGAQDALRDAEKISTRLRKLVPHLAAEIIPGGGHALLNTTVQILPFLSAAEGA
jgi:pimeloyl-ACP methyl ester carboxylesterase